MVNFFALVLACSPNVAPETLSAIVEIESSFNPYAIGVVGGYLERQPKTKEEAIATANMLYQNNYNFSLGLAQINKYNLPKYNITIEDAFDPCTNLRVGALILEECYLRATQTSNEQEALRKAFSCYYSGNFIRGFKPDAPNTLSYVDKVVTVAMNKKPTVPTVKISTETTEQSFSNNQSPSISIINYSTRNSTSPLNSAKKKAPLASVKSHEDEESSILSNPHFSSHNNGTQVF